jgi:hypothetical protein
MSRAAISRAGSALTYFPCALIGGHSHLASLEPVLPRSGSPRAAPPMTTRRSASGRSTAAAKAQRSLLALAAPVWSWSVKGHGRCVSRTADARLFSTAPSSRPRAPRVPRARASTAALIPSSRTRRMRPATMPVPAGSARAIARRAAPPARRQAPVLAGSIPARRATRAMQPRPETRASTQLTRTTALPRLSRQASTPARAASRINVTKRESCASSEASAQCSSGVSRVAATQTASLHVETRTRPEGRVRWSFRAARSRAAGRRADCET